MEAPQAGHRARPGAVAAQGEPFARRAEQRGIDAGQRGDDAGDRHHRRAPAGQEAPRSLGQRGLRRTGQLWPGHHAQRHQHGEDVEDQHQCQAEQNSQRDIAAGVLHLLGVVGDHLEANIGHVNQGHGAQNFRQVGHGVRVDEKGAAGQECLPAETSGSHETQDDVDSEEQQQHDAQENLGVAHFRDAQDVKRHKDNDHSDGGKDDRQAGEEHLQRIGEAHCRQRSVEGAGETVHRADQEREDVVPVGLTDVGHGPARDREGGRQFTVVEGNAVG